MKANLTTRRYATYADGWNPAAGLGSITTLAIPESRGRLRYYSRLHGLGSYFVWL